MSKDNQSLTKICSQCGEQKPLAAFLQLSEGKGLVYGSVCANCRKAYIEKMKPKLESDDGTRSATGHKIDAKTKVQAEKDKRELRKEQKEQDLKDREKKEETKSHQQDAKQKISSDEKKHREEYIKTGSFLDRTKHKISESQKVHGSEAQKQEASKLDLATGPVEYTRVAGTIKTTSAEFNKFKAWLGNAPIVSAAEKAAKAVEHKVGEAKDKFEEQVDKLTHGRKR